MKTNQLGSSNVFNVIIPGKILFGTGRVLNVNHKISESGE
jgi:hypothetical protein